jgi:hypothetical protein
MERRDGIFRPERNAYSAFGRLTELVLAIRSFHICLLRKTFARPCKPLEQGLHYGGRSRRVGTNVTIGRTGATARSGGRNTTSCRKASQTGRCWVDPCWGTMKRPMYFRGQPIPKWRDLPTPSGRSVQVDRHRFARCAQWAVHRVRGGQKQPYFMLAGDMNVQGQLLFQG